MLTFDHPLHKLITRLSNAMADKPATIEQAEFKMLLIRLENGLFERLPQVLISTICVYGPDVHPGLYDSFIEIARCVARGEDIPPGLMASFRMRLERYHDVPTTPIIGSGHVVGSSFLPFPDPAS